MADKTGQMLSLCFAPYNVIIRFMDVIVEFNQAAFRHNISKEDILHALETKVYDVLIGELPEKCVVIGFDRAGNPLELLYNPVDDNSIYIFHAMKLRNSTIEMLRS